VLIADAVKDEARDMARLKPQERVKRKMSTDWFDQLVVARWRLDEERRKAEQKD
jgi:hypothetical protein